MYDGFSDTSKHSVEWVQITKEFLMFAFAGGRHEASCMCSSCENKMMLSEYKMSYHLAKKGFMSNYLLWHQYEEGYDLEYEDPPLEGQNFYMLLVA
jgi:hypothetical protein